MAYLEFRPRRPSVAHLVSALVSAVLVLSTHFALSTIPRLLSSSLPLLAMLPIAGVVMVAMMGAGRGLNRIIGIHAFAPAVVVFNTMFVWGVYVTVVRLATSPILDALFHVECALLMIGLYSILIGDPGFVTGNCSHPEETELLKNQTSSDSHTTITKVASFSTRVRRCSSCKASVKGFDHHCPAFGNCIGQKNHLLFLILVIGFALAEATYTMYAFQYITVFNKNNAWLESTLSGNLVVGTVLFSLLQVLWQVVFLMWHFYCVCYNIKTDEWINWKKYPDFQLVTQEPSEGGQIRFRNPYDMGIVGNIKDFLNSTW